MNFTCPVCNYSGLFIEFRTRPKSQCPQCHSLERHRLQFHIILSLFNIDHAPLNKSMLHFAPENFLRNKFKKIFGNYTTADLYREDVDFKEDIQCLSFA